MPAGAGERGLIVAHGDDSGRQFAAVDSASRHVEPRLGASRFAAWLSPFRSRDDALAAIGQAGAVVLDEEPAR